MDQKPFTPLGKPRPIERSDLPEDLVEFYADNEGVGLETEPDRIVRLSRLDEVVRVTWPEVPIFGGDDENCPGWQDFEGFCIGVSPFLDFLYRVNRAPCCEPGSILALGPGVAGPGGRGPYTLESCLVLASNLKDWFTHLEGWDWCEYGLVPGNIWEMSPADQARLCAYYYALNPEITWGEGMPALPE